jgi:hypothetical protein
MSKSDSEVQEIRAIRAISQAVKRCDFPDFGRPNSDIEEAATGALKDSYRFALLNPHTSRYSTRKNPGRWCRCYWAVYPPSIKRSAPVMKDESSQARNRAARATSSGVPILPIG